MNKIIRDFVFYGSQLFVVVALIVCVSVISLSVDHPTSLISKPKQYACINRGENKNSKKLRKCPKQILINKKVDQIEKDLTANPRSFPLAINRGLTSTNYPNSNLNHPLLRFSPDLQINKTNSLSSNQLVKSQPRWNDWSSPGSIFNTTNQPAVNRSLQEKNQSNKVYSNTTHEHFSITSEGVLTSLTSKGKSETKLIIPSNVVKILAEAFNDCNKDLETIDIESSNLTIDPAALKPIPTKTNFRVVNDAIRDDLVKYGIEKSRISVLNHGYNWNAIIIASLATLLASGIVFKIIHILIKRHKKKNKEKTEG